ncbi:MAG: hypothetical protein E6R03_14055 [Hyphomicrobiaceae bacterium]|nr:MAG: hypothetical protein E6R03_14055 [Hyphomicrobiaceae bacterium]
MSRHHRATHNTPTPVSAAAEPPPPPAAEEDGSPHADDLRLIELAAGTRITDIDSLRVVEEGRAALARLEAAMSREMDGAKLRVAEFRQNLRVLRRRQYSAQHSGIFSPPAGAIYGKAVQPHHFNAILRTGKIGVDFEFVAE